MEEAHYAAAAVFQITGVQEEGVQVRTRPPVCAPQSVKTQRPWLSAQGKDWSQTKTLVEHVQIPETNINTIFHHRFCLNSILTIIFFIRCPPRATCQWLWAAHYFFSVTFDLSTSAHRFLRLVLFLIHSLSGHHIDSPQPSSERGNTDLNIKLNLWNVLTTAYYVKGLPNCVHINHLFQTFVLSLLVTFYLDRCD